MQHHVNKQKLLLLKIQLTEKTNQRDRTNIKILVIYMLSKNETHQPPEFTLRNYCSRDLHGHSMRKEAGFE